MCRRTPDLSNQLAALPSRKSLRLCLKAVHLLLQGCVAMGKCACVTDRHLAVRSCVSGVGGCRKYVVLCPSTPLLPVVWFSLLIHEADALREKRLQTSAAR